MHPEEQSEENSLPSRATLSAGTVAEISRWKNEAVRKMVVADDCATFEGHLYNRRFQSVAECSIYFPDAKLASLPHLHRRFPA